MIEVKVSQVGGVKFAVTARTHTVVCDQPPENGGDDTGMTPPEFLLASLGSCAAFYAAQFIKSRSLADTGVEVSVIAEKLKPPARLGNFTVQVTCPVALTEEQREGLMRSVHHCLVHNTLLSPPEIRIELTGGAHRNLLADRGVSQ
jgi:putative redox protein